MSIFKTSASEDGYIPTTEKTRLSRERIWELDFARGTAVVCMVIIHFLLFKDRVGGAEVYWPPIVEFLRNRGGAFFVFLSGICACLGRSHFKRGLAVFCCGMLLTGLSLYLFKSGAESTNILIQWGVLHMIGFAMIVYPLFRDWNVLPLALFAGAVAVSGYCLLIFEPHVHRSFLFPLGLRTIFFRAWDYFPIMPYLGVFLLGTVLGKILYKDKKSLFPEVKRLMFPVNVLCCIGRNSLLIYMVHMIVFYVVFRFLT